MTDFNIWCWNSRCLSGHHARWWPSKATRVRIRVGNLTMTNHPIHLHGHEFEVTGTDRRPRAAQPPAGPR